MDAALVRLVWQRAGHRCEYCRMAQEYDEATFEIDHIIARKHGGSARPRGLLTYGKRRNQGEADCSAPSL